MSSWTMHRCLPAREAARKADPDAGHVLAVARAAFTLRRLDAELGRAGPRLGDERAG